MSHHISGDHVCYVQVDEAELSSSAILILHMCTAGRSIVSWLVFWFWDGSNPIFWFISRIPVGKGGSLDDKVENQDSSSAAPHLQVTWTAHPPTTCLLPSCSQGDPWWFVHLGWNYRIWWSRRKSGQGPWLKLQFFEVKLTFFARSPMINGRSPKCFCIPAGSSTQLAVDFDSESPKFDLNLNTQSWG